MKRPDLDQVARTRLQRIAQHAGFWHFGRVTTDMAEIYLAWGQIAGDDGLLRWGGYWGAGGIARRIDADPKASEKDLRQLLLNNAYDFLSLAKELKNGVLQEGAFKVNG